MGVLEELVNTIQGFNTKLNDLTSKVREIELKEEEEEVWRVKDVCEYVGFKVNITKEFLSKQLMLEPFYIGRTPCYLKKTVIEKIQEYSQLKGNNVYRKQKKEQKQDLPLLYTIK